MDPSVVLAYGTEQANKPCLSLEMEMEPPSSSRHHCIIVIKPWAEHPLESDVSLNVWFHDVVPCLVESSLSLLALHRCMMLSTHSLRGRLTMLLPSVILKTNDLIL